MLLKFGVKRAPESCQNLGQKVESKLGEIWIKTVKSGQGAGWTGSWAGPSGVPPGLDPVRLAPGLNPVRGSFLRELRNGASKWAGRRATWWAGRRR
jgi:hypothetical protein